MYETHARSFVKALVWRVLATITSFAVTYIFTGSIKSATEISLGSAAISTIIYYFHERVWDAIEWGRTKRYSK